MRDLRRAAITIGVLMVALLPVTAAVSAAAASPEIPVAITQPVGRMASALAATGSVALPESGLIMLVGSGLLGLAGIVRRSTRV